MPGPIVRSKAKQEVNDDDANLSAEADADGSSCCSTWLSCLRRNLFVLLLILSVCLGIGLGVALRYLKSDWTPRELSYYKFPGELLLRMLQMIILPLVVTSMIAGISSLGRSTSSKIGLIALVYYLSTTLIAVIIGIVLVVSIRPGDYGKKTSVQKEAARISDMNAVDSALDLIRNLIPDNLFDACLHRVQTTYKPNPLANATESSNSTVPVLESVPGTNLLGILVFSVAFGIALGQLGRTGQQARKFFDGCSEAILLVVQAIVWFTPIGIMFLISGKIIEMKNFVRTIAQLGLYTTTVVAALAIHGFIVLPLAYLVFVRRNPFTYMYGCLQALLTAVSTASSSATIPVTLYCIEEVNGVSKQISRFVVPVGATINMDGTALYEAVASVFIAQLNGITLDFVQLVIVSLTATLAAIGAAGIPDAGLVTMMIVLTAVGLPTGDVSLILAIDWFLDRLRTAINVWGDCIGAGIVESLSRTNSKRIVAISAARAAAPAAAATGSRDEGDDCKSVDPEPALEFRTSTSSSRSADV